MKRYISRTVALLIVCALAGLTAFADSKSDRINFDEDFQLNGTLIKKGTYKVSFDEPTGELTIKKNEKLIAKTAAHAEPATEKAERTMFSMATENGTKMLRSVTYSGDDRVIVVGAGNATGANKTGDR